MKKPAFKITAFFLFFFFSAAAAFAGGQTREVPIGATVLNQGQQCEPAPDGWRASWIVSFEALGEMMKRRRSHRIGAASDSLPDVDFDSFGVLAVEMGRRSSAGYGFKTDEVTAKRVGKTVTVTLPYVAPAPGAMTAQVMTSPWVLIQIPLAEFSEIRVEDQDGGLLDQIDLP